MRCNDGVVIIDTLKERVDNLHNRVDKLETQVDKFSDKQSVFEQRIEQKIEGKLNEYNAEMKALIKESNVSSRNRGQKLFQQTGAIGDILSDINVTLTEIKKDTKQNSKDIEKMEESDKWKTRTIAGFVVAILLMVVGTLWDMIIGFPF